MPNQVKGLIRRWTWPAPPRSGCEYAKTAGSGRCCQPDEGGSIGGMGLRSPRRPREAARRPVKKRTCANPARSGSSPRRSSPRPRSVIYRLWPKADTAARARDCAASLSSSGFVCIAQRGGCWRPSGAAKAAIREMDHRRVRRNLLGGKAPADSPPTNVTLSDRNQPSRAGQIFKEIFSC